jgi:DNA-binding beta-propeller fold protein YncE
MRGAWIAAALAATAVLGACGSSHTAAATPEPADSPPLRAAPAGRVLHVGREPEGVVVDGSTQRVAVGLRRPPALALLDARSGRPVRQVGLAGAPRHLALAGPGGPVLVPAEKIDALLEVPLGGGRVRSIRVGRVPHDATAAAGRLWVGEEFGYRASVIAGSIVLRRLATPAQPGGLAATDDRVAVVAVRERVLRLYDARRLRALATVPAGVGPTHVVAGRGGLLYVADTQGDAVLYFRTRPRLELAGRITLPGVPYGIAIDPRRGRLWVTLTAHNQLVWLQTADTTDRPGEVARYDTVRQPNTVGVDPRTGRVFVAGRTDGVVQIVTPESSARAAAEPRD